MSTTTPALPVEHALLLAPIVRPVVMTDVPPILALRPFTSARSLHLVAIYFICILVYRFSSICPFIVYSPTTGLPCPTIGASHEIDKHSPSALLHFTRDLKVVPVCGQNFPAHLRGVTTSPSEGAVGFCYWISPRAGGDFPDHNIPAPSSFARTKFYSTWKYFATYLTFSCPTSLSSFSCCNISFPFRLSVYSSSNFLDQISGKDPPFLFFQVLSL